METPDFPRCPGNSSACLGMVEFDYCGTQGLVERLDQEIENEEKAAAAERKRKSLSLPKPSKKLALSSTSRLNTTTDAEVQEAAKGYVPANTAKSTGWAVNTCTAWAKHRNSLDGNKENACHVDLLDKEYPPAVMCSSLQRFILEARRTDGTKYPAKTLYAILCGLLRHSREVQVDPVNFLNREDSHFKKLHGTCDVVFRKLQQDGIGATKKSAQVIGEAEEDLLWQKGAEYQDTDWFTKGCVLRGESLLLAWRRGEEKPKAVPVHPFQ